MEGKSVKASKTGSLISSQSDEKGFGALQGGHGIVESELVETKADQRDMPEESAASSEEVKLSNEVLRAMNEELRSATEEFETSRGGLQAIIEELTTVNEALKGKVDQLARSNSEFQNLLAAITEIAIVFLDRDLGVKDFTRSARALFNLIATDVGRPLSDLTLGIEYPEVVADAEHALAHLKPSQREVRVGDRWLIARILPYRTQDDHAVAVVLTFLDITEWKRAEEDILQFAADSERLRRIYETVLTNTPDFMYVFSLDHKVLYANEALIKMWGRGRDGAIGKTFLEIGYEPWHAEMHDREIDQVRATRQPIRGEVPFNGTNGRRDYEYIFVPIIGADGEVEAVAGTTRDVTDRNETEKRSKFLITLVDTIRPLSDPVAVEAEACRLLGELLKANRVAYFEVRGDNYVVERDYTDSVHSIVGQYPVASFGSELLAVYRAGRTATESDVDAVSSITSEERAAYAGVQIGAYVGVPLVKDGVFTAGLAVHMATPRLWTDAEVGIIEETADRTWEAVERVRAEAALARAEERASFVRRSCGVGFWYCDLPFDVLEWDELVKAHFHLPRGASVTIQNFYERMHPDDREPTRRAIERSIADRTPYDTEYRTVDPDTGTVTWVRAIGRTFYDGEGNPIRFDGVTLDLTDRKLAEQRLEAGKQELDFALAAADLGYWSLNLADHTARHTLRHDQIFGYDVLLPEWTYEMFLEHVLPEDRAAVDVAFKKSVSTGEVWAIECRIRRADGAVRHIWKKGLVRADAGGKVERMLAIVGDITDRRQAEERQEFLIRLADALRPISDPTEVQGVASRILGEYLGANRVVYFEIRDEDYVIELDYAAGVQSLVGRYQVSAFGQALLDALLSGRTVIEKDATSEPDRPPDERAAFAAIQVRGHVDVPLVKGGRFVAGMTVHVADPRDWTREEVALIEETAERTWGAVERARAENEIVRLAAVTEQQKRLFDTALSNTADYNFLFDLDGRILYANRALLDLWGRTAHQALGKTLAELDYPPDAEAQVVRNTRRVIETGETVRDETPYNGPTGARRYYEYILAPVFESGKVIQVAGASRDVTDHRNAMAELEEADRLKNEFLATLAHELRNPLAPISNGLDIMRMANYDPALVEETSSIMERQLKHMVRLVDDLMDVSRINNGKLVLRKERATLASVVDIALETSRPLVEKMDHSVTVELPDEPIMVYVDLTRLAQVFSNLINNAAKYTERGGQIWLTARLRGNDVVVSVKDTGIGIAADQLPRVFEMFTQVKGSLDRAQGGLGIGLMLVRRLVEMHGGSIEARSDGPGKGSEFVVHLPAVTEADIPEESEKEDGGSSKSKLRVLIVDDSHDIAYVLAKTLDIDGHSTLAVYSGEEAIGAASEFRPDVILLDIGLPGMSGHEACRRIRELPGGKDFMIIAQSGWGSADDRRESQEAGFDHHLVKPFNMESLMKLLQDSEKRIYRN